MRAGRGGQEGQTVAHHVTATPAAVSTFQEPPHARHFWDCSHSHAILLHGCAYLSGHFFWGRFKIARPAPDCSMYFGLFGFLLRYAAN
jgi:hypothetical protein